MTTLSASESLGALVQTSQRLGADPDLVLHGGGNSSVKATAPDSTGTEIPVLWVKASGGDMATAGPEGYVALALDQVRRLLPPARVPDRALRSALRATLLDPDAPDPSVETLVHACLPEAAVVHSHADALLVLGAARGREGLADALGGDVLLVDYAMPGPDLVAAVAAAWRDRAQDAVGVMVLGHGLFTVGATPAEALERHVDVVGRAAALLPAPTETSATALPPASPSQLAALRARICDEAGHPVLVRRHADAEVADFVADDDVLGATAAGPLTPDHVSWTKPWPLVGTDVEAFADGYRDYVARNRTRRDRDALDELDPAPRVLLDPVLGMLTVGRTPAEAAAVGDIYRHTLRAIRAASRLGRWSGADEGHVFDLEYWDYQQEKRRRRSTGLPLTGQVALVTGAASGIGRGCAGALLDAGATVVGWDRAESVSTTFDADRYLGRVVDVTDATGVATALETCAEQFGGLDMLVVAAGIFPASAAITELAMDQWRRTMAVNVDAVAELFGQAQPLLAQARPYGRVVLIASKNVLAPGTGAAAYSASKAAVTQLARVAALEWAGDGIRVNMVHPDAVFDTGLWTPELLATRAAHYGLSVDEYKRRNLLHAEITSAKVGALCRSLCSAEFECTTGAQIPIDGGSDRVI